jgi:hypothetical protein
VIVINDRGRRVEVELDPVAAVQLDVLRDDLELAAMLVGTW